MASGLGLQRKIFRVPNVAAAGCTIQHNDKDFRALSIDYFLVVRIVNGERLVRRAGHECRGGPGDYILMTPGTYDTVNFTNESGVYRSEWIAWDAKILLHQEPVEKLVNPFEGATVLPLMDEEFTHWFSEARRTLETARGLPIHVIKHRVSEIILWLRHQGFHLSASRTNSLDKQILAMVNRNPSGEWSVAKLADMLEISESTLRRRLAALGVKPKHLILNARMSNAIGLLQSTDLSVAEIASKVGYESSPRFASRFRSRFGFAPSELRGHRRGHPGNGATPNVPGRREN